MKKVAARVRARRAKEIQKDRVVETTSPRPVAQAGAAGTSAAEDPEPSNAELEEASSTVGNGAKKVSVTFQPNVRSHRDGAAKRSQPQNKPRSQRKK
jgi:hypothetical protein